MSSPSWPRTPASPVSILLTFTTKTPAYCAFVHCRIISCCVCVRACSGVGFSFGFCGGCTLAARILQSCFRVCLQVFNSHVASTDTYRSKVYIHYLIIYSVHSYAAPNLLYFCRMAYCYIDVVINLLPNKSLSDCCFFHLVYFSLVLVFCIYFSNTSYFGLPTRQCLRNFVLVCNF